MAQTSIEWTNTSWNPVVGCTRASAGCDFCYAVSMTRRASAMGLEKYDGLVNPGKNHFNGTVRTHPEMLGEPLRWKKPRRVFVNSMSDLFHPGVPLDFIQQALGAMGEACWHAFQILTKRPERAAEFAGSLDWPPNVLFGTSIEDDRVLHRLDALCEVPAYTRFISCEPLIGPLGHIDLSGVHWVIVGGESGPKARPMHPSWACEIRDQCVDARVPFFFKQWGKYDENGSPVGKGKAGRMLDGRTWEEHPAIPGYPDPEAVGVALPRPLPDERWNRISELLPGRPGAPGGTGMDNRSFIEAVRWKAYSGRPWRDLPPQYGKWNTVAVRVKRWAEGGHWDRVCSALDDPLLSRYLNVPRLPVDSQS